MFNVELPKVENLIAFTQKSCYTRKLCLTKEEGGDEMVIMVHWRIPIRIVEME